MSANICGFPFALATADVKFTEIMPLLFSFTFHLAPFAPIVGEAGMRGGRRGEAENGGATTGEARERSRRVAPARASRPAGGG